jgi:hypothetical protein
MNLQRDYKIESGMDKVNTQEDSKLFLEPTMTHPKNANKPQKFLQLNNVNNGAHIMGE